MIDRTLSDILETEQRIAISLSVCYRVRLFCPDRIAYHSGIGVRLLIAFLLPSVCPSRTVFPWWLAYPYPTASHHRPWWYLHWLSRSCWMCADYRGLYASESRPRGLGAALYPRRRPERGKSPLRGESPSIAVPSARPAHDLPPIEQRKRRRRGTYGSRSMHRRRSRKPRGYRLNKPNDESS